jgi:hypothetical protein
MDLPLVRQVVPHHGVADDGCADEKHGKRQACDRKAAPLDGMCRSGNSDAGKQAQDHGSHRNDRQTWIIERDWREKREYESRDCHAGNRHVMIHFCWLIGAGKGGRFGHDWFRFRSGSKNIRDAWENSSLCLLNYRHAIAGRRGCIGAVLSTSKGHCMFGQSSLKVIAIKYLRRFFHSRGSDSI